MDGDNQSDGGDQQEGAALLLLRGFCAGLGWDWSIKRVGGTYVVSMWGGKDGDDLTASGSTLFGVVRSLTQPPA